MKLIKELVLEIEGKLTEVPLEKAVMASAKEYATEIGVKSYGTDKAYAMAAFKDVFTEAAVDFSTIEDKEDRKQQEGFYKHMKTLLATHKKNWKKLDDERVAGEVAEKKHGEMIVAAINTGAASTEKFEVAVISNIQKMVGDDFVIDDKGLRVAEGADLDEVKLARAISSLAEGTEKGNKLTGTMSLAAGDLVNIIRKELGEEKGDQLIEQAVAVRGQSKYTVIQAGAVASYMDELYPDRNDRPKGLTYTHLQEAKNYAKDKKGEVKITPGKVRKIIDKVVAGQDGKVLSCSAMRDLLKDERPDLAPQGENGSTPGTKKTEKTAPEPTVKYLYEHYESGGVFFSNELREDILKEKAEDDTPAYRVLDLSALVVLKPNGKKADTIMELPVKEEAAADGMPE